MEPAPSLAIADLLAAYRSGRRTPTAVVEELWRRADCAPERHVWITRTPLEQLRTWAAALERRPPEGLPLYGVPFVIKDNIDLAGVPTTAGCPRFAYVPPRSATAVERLIDAGALPLGKTNLDQFATGLTGTRSPYGACRNAVDPEYISGGSSSGSAVAVASGLASFALGTDTAGSGRVPAAFNGIVGLKPSLGRISTRGVIPACRSLDCVSVFALSCEDAARVLDVAAGFDEEDAYSRVPEDALIGAVSFVASTFEASTFDGRRVGVPRVAQRAFFGDEAYARLFEATLERLARSGAAIVEVDFTPFFEAARLLYEGPWVAERYAAIGDFMKRDPEALHPVTRRVIEGGLSFSAVDAFRAGYALATLKRQVAPLWRDIDVGLTPTTPTIYRRTEVEADPITLNSRLGYYTNFMNLLDLAAVAVPAGCRPDGLPFGISLFAPRGTDRALLALAGSLDRTPAGSSAAAGGPSHASAVATGRAPTADRSPAIARHAAPPERSRVAVCGAHMQGLALNHALTERGGELVRRARTAPCYRFFVLPGGSPARPGLVRAAEGGAAIELEVWTLPRSELGGFLESIPAPLGLGTVELEDGETVIGFLCEAYAVASALEITGLGGWRAYLEIARASSSTAAPP